MGHIILVKVLVMTSMMIDKTRSGKADQSAKPGNATANGQCTNIAISWTNKIE